MAVGTSLVHAGTASLVGAAVTDSVLGISASIAGRVLGAPLKWFSLSKPEKKTI